MVAVCKETFSGTTDAPERTGLQVVRELVTAGTVKKALVHDSTRIIAAVDGYASLGLYDDAWKTLEFPAGIQADAARRAPTPACSISCTKECTTEGRRAVQGDCGEENDSLRHKAKEVGFGAAKV